MTGFDPGGQAGDAERHNLARDMRQMYDAGASVREIAEKYERSYGSVHRLLRMADVTFRPRGGPTSHG
ncbi:MULTISPECIES: helix-turn-helix domain-containing protein [Kitasatospora]|uniref:Helix-turn-helix domain-containing protein n=1 Tax=Kitasatospora cathayae TaxID=3004092 RepID=A0ABY7PY89_9ACTN|nr:helix-turn-helix domain-containing protein [Kitasatospora sp. HUAS 3-15]WBP85339.1 helix-turn-helix domain-containing protein [Kitasatospora sp. HUAS 3-15]